MARKTKTEQLNDIHEAAKLEFDTIQAALRDERLQCLEDRRFYSISGAQWEGRLGQQFENKPKLEVNKIHLSVIRIINEYRNNRITVDFKSKDGISGDKIADMCDMVYRADENDSVAQEAYDNAFEEGVAGGFGAWRLRADYEDESDPEDDRQRINFEPIFDADSSVFFDLQAKKQDKSDAKCCFVLTSMTREAYIDEWGDDPATWPKEIHHNEFDWASPNVVYVAEYYKVEATKENINVWQTLDGEELRLTDDQLEDQIEILQATGAQELRIKKVRRKKIRKYIMSGGKILEDCGHIAGSCIPIIPFYGKRWFVDNVERCMGHVRLSKDSQRLKNMQLSKLAEISALGSVEKPLMTPEQVAGHQLLWEQDNIKNYPYLLINPLTDVNGNKQAAPPVGYTKTATVPPALAALLQITEDDIQDLLGNQQGGEQIAGNISTETAHLVQNRLDMQTFIYMSNFSKAMKRCGEVWLSMAKDVYVEEDRELDTLTANGETSSVTLMQTGIDPTTKETTYLNDFSKAKMKVITDVGPSSSTKRMATVRALTAMLTKATDPETQQVIGSMIMMNMEGEGVDDVRDFFRKRLLRMGVVKPTEDESREMAEEAQNQQPTPQDQYFEAAAAKELAEASEKQANTLLKQAQTDETRADTAKTLEEMERDQIKAALEIIEKLGPRVTPPEFANLPIDN